LQVVLMFCFGKKITIFTFKKSLKLIALFSKQVFIRSTSKS
jgi:hypothetical protein